MYDKKRLVEDIEQIIKKHINEYYQNKYNIEDFDMINEADLFFDTFNSKMSPFDPDGNRFSGGGGNKTLQ